MFTAILNSHPDELKKLNGFFTATEIAQQPEVWLKINSIIKKKKLAALFDRIKCNNTDIILTGAGTSAFIGNSLESLFMKNINIPARSIPTTQIATHPESYFSKTKPTLLISFARSGNSPESLAVVNLANQICKSVKHLIVTCNKDGKLAKYTQYNDAELILLPPETDDQSLAMTSSFTSMLLTGILLTKLDQVYSINENITLLSEYGRNILNKYLDVIKNICTLNFNRSVFLGSGSMIGCAEECHLKLQELTDGQVIAKHDSFLGFRHGPKAVITPETLMVYLLSTDNYIQQYEKDLIQSISSEKKGCYSLAVMEKDNPDITADYKIILSSSEKQSIDSDFLLVCNTLIGQLLGYYKSLQLNLSPDNPCVSGTITRVVQGVKIYPFQNN